MSLLVDRMHQVRAAKEKAEAEAATRQVAKEQAAAKIEEAKKTAKNYLKKLTPEERRKTLADRSPQLSNMIKNLESQ